MRATARPTGCRLPPTCRRRRSRRPLSGTSIDDDRGALQQAGDAGRSIAVIGAARNVGTTLTAIALARTLSRTSRVVLVDLAFASPNIDVISNDPAAPGIAELVRGTASFGDIITRDRVSRLHLVAAGQVGNDADGICRLADAMGSASARWRKATTIS